MRPRRAWVIIVAAAGALSLWALRGPSEDVSQVEFSGPVMGTVYVVKLIGSAQSNESKPLQANVEAALNRVDALMSTYDPNSELSRFNRHAGTDWMPVSAETAEVVAAALDISVLSGGAFDVTVGPLVNLWGFGPEGAVVDPPTAEAIAGSLQRVGFQNIAVRGDPPALRKSRADVYVDLSAIAKGYAVDLAGRALNAAGIENYLVDVGGEILARGHNAAGHPWRVAVEKPLSGERSVQRLLELHNTAVATSGDYRNFFELDGHRYSHSIDPRNGWPVPHELASVSVLASSAMRADALATALMVMGPEAALEFADREHIASLLIVRRGGGQFEELESVQLRRLLAAGEDPR